MAAFVDWLPLVHNTCDGQVVSFSAADQMASLRDPTVELIGQALGSAVLAGTMRAPIGTALFVSFMGRSTDRNVDAALVGLLVAANLLAVWLNPLSGLGQVYGEGGGVLESSPGDSAASGSLYADMSQSTAKSGAKEQPTAATPSRPAPSNSK